MKIISKNSSWFLESIEVNYLFSYLLKFGCKTKIEGPLLLDLKTLFEKALQDLICNCYNEPSIKSRQKHPTRFEKFEFYNNKYTVNYVHSTPERLMFLLFTRIQMIENAINTNGWIILDMKHTD